MSLKSATTSFFRFIRPCIELNQNERWILAGILLLMALGLGARWISRHAPADPQPAVTPPMEFRTR